MVVGDMPSVSILRVFRLVRLARAFKAAAFFQELNQLIRGFVCAMKAIFWGILKILLILTIWGILAVQLIHPINLRLMERKPHIYEGCDRCHRSFSTVFDSILTFWQQVVAGDSWGTVSAPIIEESPMTFFFFMAVLVSVNLVMLNLILAVIVEAAMTANIEDEERKSEEAKKAQLEAERRLIELCAQIDVDKSGQLTVEEFLEGFDSMPEFENCLRVITLREQTST
jgi:hypothetical protein